MRCTQPEKNPPILTCIHPFRLKISFLASQVLMAAILKLSFLIVSPFHASIFVECHLFGCIVESLTMMQSSPPEKEALLKRKFKLFRLFCTCGPTGETSVVVSPHAFICLSLL